MAIPYLACMALVARVYALPPRVLPSIQAVEGGAIGSVHLNRAVAHTSTAGWLSPSTVAPATMRGKAATVILETHALRPVELSADLPAACLAECLAAGDGLKLCLPGSAS